MCEKYSLSIVVVSYSWIQSQNAHAKKICKCNRSSLQPLLSCQCKGQHPISTGSKPYTPLPKNTAQLENPRSQLTSTLTVEINVVLLIYASLRTPFSGWLLDFGILLQPFSPKQCNSHQPPLMGGMSAISAPSLKASESWANIEPLTSEDILRFFRQVPPCNTESDFGAFKDFLSD